MSEVMLWKILDLGFDLLAFKMKRDEIVAEAKSRQEAGATAEELAQWLHDLRSQKAAEARKEVTESPDYDGIVLDQK
jgi:hypothetical protein